jgi:hypothetical protein
MERDFKGVWIDKQIWLNTELTWMEKLMIVEINSLDNENGCYASNAYFAEFFQISNGRASQIISSLSEKNYISVEQIKEGGQFVKRVLKILYRGIKNTKTGIKNIKGGYLENDEYNNTLKNNTINNTLLKAPLEKSWKNDYEIYKDELRKAYQKFTTDKSYISERQNYHPGLNIILSLEKACKDYWVTEAGWTYKKKQKIDKIDWKRTFNNALTQKSNQVWLSKETPKTELRGAAYEPINRPS